MAPKVYINAFISVAGVDLSARCVKLEVEDGFNEIDVKAMSNTAENTTIGLRKQSVKVTLLQDFSAGSVHPTLQAALGTAVAVVARPDAGAKSTSNPEWSGTLLLPAYNPIGASVGDKQEVAVEFKTQGTALTYATA